MGDEEFRRELLEQMEERAGPNHYGGEIGEMTEQKAQRLVREGLFRLRWNETDLQKRPKRDPGKVNLARRLREQTTVTLQWVADRLNMGTAGYVYHLLLEPTAKRKSYLKYLGLTLAWQVTITFFVAQQLERANSY